MSDKDSGGAIHCPLHGDGMDPDPDVEQSRYQACPICKMQVAEQVRLQASPAYRAWMRRWLTEMYGWTDAILDERGY